MYRCAVNVLRTPIKLRSENLLSQEFEDQDATNQ